MTRSRSARCLHGLSALLIWLSACKSDFKKTDTKPRETATRESSLPLPAIKAPQFEGESDLPEEIAPPLPVIPNLPSQTNSMALEPVQSLDTTAPSCRFSHAQLFDAGPSKTLNGNECGEVHILFQKDEAILENQSLHFVNVQKVFLPYQFRNFGSLIIESKNTSPTLIQSHGGEDAQLYSNYVIRTSGLTRIENAVIDGSTRGIQVLLSAKQEIPALDLKNVELRNVGMGIDLPQFNSAELTKKYESTKPFQFLNVSFNNVLVPLSLGFPISLQGFQFENRSQSPQFSHNVVKMSEYYGIEGVFEKGIPYVISQTSQLLPQSILRITPGAILKFSPHSTLLIAGARIEAHGTSENKVMFTSIKDDVGGDSNQDGSSTLPSNLDWGGIRIYKILERARVSMQYVDVRFAGTAIVDSDVQFQDFRFFQGSCSSFTNTWDFLKNPIDIASENTITALAIRGTSKVILNRGVFAEPPEASIVLGGASTKAKLEIIATSVTYENAPKPYVKCEFDCHLYSTQGI
jgi:hypothetical protein